MPYCLHHPRITLSVFSGRVLMVVPSPFLIKEAVMARDRRQRSHRCSRKASHHGTTLEKTEGHASFLVSREEIMSVPNEPIVPPPAPPIGNPEPERDPGETPPPDGPEPDDGDDPMTQAHAQEAQRSSTWGLLCRGVQVHAAD